MFSKNHASYSSAYSGPLGGGLYILANKGTYASGSFAMFEWRDPFSSTRTTYSDHVSFFNVHSNQHFSFQLRQLLWANDQGRPAASRYTRPPVSGANMDLAWPQGITKPPNGPESSDGIRFGVHVTGGIARSSTSLAYVGNVVNFLTDPEAPAVASVEHVNRPEGWVGGGIYSARVRATDPGLGVLEVGIRGARRSHIYLGCSGSPNHDPCPTDVTRQIHYPIDQWPEGVHRARGDAQDVVAREAFSTQSWDVKIDRSAPSATLGGSLYAGRGSFVADGTETLTVDAGDAYSGVESVAYEVKSAGSGTVVRSGNTTNPGCDANGCPTSLSHSFDVDLSGLASDGYAVQVTTSDQLGDDATYGAQHRDVQSFDVEVDHTAPEVTSVTTTPDRWATDGDRLTSSVAGSDDRSGVKSFDLAFPDGSAAATVTRDCAGSDPNGSPPACQTSDSAAFGYDVDGGRFPAEGRVEVRATVRDAAGNQSPQRPGEVRIDRSPPDLALGGTLYASRDALLVLPSYELSYEAWDGSTASPQQERSGARQVRVLVRRDAEGEQFVQKHAAPEQGCPQGSCSLDGRWTFDTAEYEPNTRYVIRTVATDQLGHETVEDFSVYVVAGIGAELPTMEDRTGLEDWWHYESVQTGAGTRAHVNFATGNLVWHATRSSTPGAGCRRSRT